MPGPFDASKLPTQEETERKQTLDLTQGFARERSPEDAAEALRYAQETGVPYGQAEAALKGKAGLLGTLRRTPSWDALVREAPVLAERLSNPGRAAAMQDDVEKLHGIEKLFGGFGDIGSETKSAAIRGNIQRKLANIGWRQVLGEATPEDLAEAAKLEEEMKAYPEHALGFIPGIAPAAAESAPIMAQTIVKAGAYAAGGAGVGAITGSIVPGIGTGAGALTGAGVGFKIGTGVESGKSEAGLALREFMQIPGVDESSARGAAFAVGIVNGALEGISIGVILKKAPGAGIILRAPRQMLGKVLKSAAGRKVLAGLTKRIAEVGVTEGITEALQELSTILGGTAVNPETQGFSDAVARAWAERGRVKDAGVKGFQGGLGFGAVSITGGIVSDLASARKAQERKAFFEELSALGKDSKTRDRLPAEYREFLDKVQEKYGVQESVTVPKEKLFQLLEEEGFTEQDIQEKLPGVAAQAAKAGPEDEITVLLPDFAAHVAPLDGFNKLADDLRIGDEPTPREAVEIEKRAKEVLKEMQSEEKREGTVPEPSRKVFEDVLGKLTDVGVDESVARHYATLWTSFAESRASRKGTDTFEEYQGFGLDIGNSELADEARAETATLMQSTLSPGVAEELDAQLAPLREQIAGLDPRDAKYGAVRRQMSEIVDTRLRAEGVISDPSLIDRAKRFFVDKFTRTELHQDVDEDHSPLWFFQSSRNVIEAKQVKGDAKSWMAIISKGVKKEEMEFLGIEEFLTGYGKQSIPKSEILDYLEAHDLPVEEQVLSDEAGGLTDEEQDDITGRLGNFGIGVQGSPGEDNFTYTSMDREPRRTDDIDEILASARDNGIVNRQDKERIQELIGDAKSRVGDEDAFEQNTATASMIEDIFGQHNGLDVSVEEDGTIVFDGYVEDEVENTLTDRDEIIEKVKDEYGRRDAEVAEGLMEQWIRNEGSEASEKTEYGNYTIKRGKAHVEGSYRELLFYAPNFESRKYEAPHWPETGYEKGLIAHVRFSTHLFPNTDPAQAGKYNSTKKRVFVIEEIQSDLHQHARNAVQAATSEIKEMYRKLLGLNGTQMRDLKVSDLEKMAAEQAKTFPNPSDEKRIERLKKRTGYITKSAIEERLEASYNPGAQRAEFIDPDTGRKMSFRPNSTGNPEKVLQPEPTLRARAAKTMFDEIIGAEEGVPDAPFKTTWDEFAAKRLLMWAAAEGFDEIVWPTGKIQADRYDLAEAVSRLTWRRGIMINGREFESTIQAAGVLGGHMTSTGEIMDADGNTHSGETIYFLDAYDKNDTHISNDQLDAGFTEAKLRNAVGSGIAQQIVDSANDSGEISGPDLSIGGEGMAFAYDKKLVSFMEKQIKKFGGKVSQVPHPALTKSRFKSVLAGGKDPIEFAKEVKEKLAAKSEPMQNYAIAARDISERVVNLLSEDSSVPRLEATTEAKSIGDLQNRIEFLEAGIASWQKEIDRIPAMIRTAEKAKGDLGQFENLGGMFPQVIYEVLDRAKGLQTQIEAGERVVARRASEEHRLQRHADEAKFIGRDLTDEERAKLDGELDDDLAAGRQRLEDLKNIHRELVGAIDITSPTWWKENVASAYRTEVKIRKKLIDEIEKLSAQRAELGISSGNFSDVNAALAKMDTAAGWLHDVIKGAINDPMFGINRALRFGAEYSTYGRFGIEDYEISAFKTLTGIDLTGQIENTEEKDETPVWRADFPKELREQIKTKGMSLFQRGQGEKQGENYRGKIDFDEARKWFKITLTGSANLSTFLHESGHAFLEIVRRDALAGHAQSAADLAVLERWMAAGGGDRTAQLERFARGFERFLMEGKAPSSRLAEIFTAFKEWLKFIYPSFLRLKVELTPEVREVMDRLLATDIEIDKAKQAIGLAPALGPTELEPTDLQAFRQRWDGAVEAKRQEMEQDAMTALRRAVRDDQTAIRREVEQEAKTTSPHARAWSAFEYLRNGKTLDGSTIAPEAGKKLSKATIREYIEEGDRRFIKLGKLIADDGMDADALAPFLGFADGQELVTALLDAPSRAGWIKEQADARIADKYPDSKIASLAEKAMAKLHDPTIDRVLEEELDAFDRLSGAKPAPRARDVLRLAARRRVEEMTLQEMQPGKEARNEERASREVLEAVSKKDYATARDARRRQMWHRFMYREVVKAKEEIGKVRDYLHEFETLPVQKKIGKAGERYTDAIAAILEGIDLSRSSNTALARRAALEKYLQEMEAEGEPVAIPPELRAELGLKSWKQMSLSEIRAVRDAVANIESLAMLKNKLFDGRKRRDFIVTTTKLAAHINANVGINFADGIGEPSWWEKKKDFLRKSRANLTKIEFLCRVLDGGKTAGWAHELIFQPMADAQARKVAMTKAITEELIKPFSSMSLEDRIRFDRTVDFLGHKLRYREVIAFILNLGNAGNKEKTLKGFNMSEEAVQKKLDEMHAAGIIKDSDLDLVQHIWTTIDKLWPEIRGLAQRNIGLAPPKVEATPLTIGSKTLLGGYYPVVYNRRLDHKAEQIAQRKTGDLFENNFLLPAVEKGFTESRTKFFAPVSLSLDVIPTHINEVIHYLTHYEAVRAVDKLTSSKAVKEAITEGLGREVFGLFRPWLQAIAADGAVHESTKWYDALLRRLRLGSSIALLGFKMTTGLKQIFGLSSSAKEIGHYTLTGARIFVENVFTGKGFGADFNASAVADPEVTDRDIAAMFRKLEGTFSLYGQAKDKMAHFALAWMMLNQRAVNSITWYGAREKAMAEGHEDPVRYADAVVRMSQSGGAIKDLAAVQRGSEMEKTLTVMYTYFSVLFNQVTEAMPNKSRGQKVAILAARWWWLVTLPTLMDAALAAGIPDDDKDRERYLEALTFGQIMYFGRSIPLAGQVAESFIGDRQARYGAWIETLLRGAQSSKDVLSGTATKSDIKNVVDLLGATTGLPASAAKSAFAWGDEYLSGSMQEPVQNLLFRSPSEFK